MDIKNLKTLSKKCLSNNYLILLTILIIYFIYGLSRIKYGINVYDEGLVLCNAESILNGNIPYKDFWTIYTPGQYYLVAMLFKIFGYQIITTRIFSDILLILSLACIYLIIKEIIPEKIALIFLVFTMIALGTFGFGSVSPVGTALLFILINCIYMIKYIKTNNNLYLIISGLLTSLVLFFKQDLGLYTLLTEIIFLFIYTYFNDESYKKKSKKIIKSFKSWKFYLTGIMITGLPIIFLFSYYVPMSDLISQLIIFSTKIYPQYRHLPFPSFILNLTPLNADLITNLWIILNTLFRNFIFYFPLILDIMAVIFIIFKHKKQRLEQNDWIIIFFTLFSIISLNLLDIRPDIVHLFPVMVLSTILFSFIAYKIYTLKQNKYKTHLKIFFTVFLMITMISFALNWNTSDTTDIVHINLSRTHDIYTNPQEAQDLKNAVNYIQKEVSPNQYIFVGNPRHDKIFVNNIIFYFLSGRQSATKYTELHPGLATTHNIQNQIISEINSHNVTYIIIWNNGTTQYSEPNLSGKRSNAKELDNFIKNNYRIIRNFGPYEILKRV